MVKVGICGLWVYIASRARVGWMLEVNDDADPLRGTVATRSRSQSSIEAR